MTHQIASFQHEKGTILVYDQGIVIEQEGKEQIFLAEDLFANAELFTNFLALDHEGLVISFGGMVAGDEGNGSDQECRIYSIGNDLFVITNGDKNAEDAVVVNRSFLELLESVITLVIVEGRLSEDVDCESWIIEGSFPWVDNVSFAINKDHFEICYKAEDTGNYYFFHTDREDRGLWFRSMGLAEQMLSQGLKDGSWQIVGVDGTEKKMRLEVEEERVVVSLHDPALENINVSVYLDKEMFVAIKTLLNEVWVYEDDDIDVDVYYLSDMGDDDEDDDDDGDSIS